MHLADVLLWEKPCHHTFIITISSTSQLWDQAACTIPPRAVPMFHCLNKGNSFPFKKKITQSCKPQFSFSSYSSATCCESLNHHKTMAREGNYILNKESKWRSALSLHHPNSNLLHSGTTCSQLATWFPPPLTFSIFSFSYGTSNPMGQGNFCPSHGEEGQRNSFLEAERFSLLYIHC